MEWNNGKERALFHKEQAKLRKQYLAAGMTEEQIQALYAFDCEWYKNRRREAVHTQRLDIQTSEDEDINKDNPLYKKFFEKLAVEDNHADYSRYGWLEEIQDERLYVAISKLTEKDKGSLPATNSTTVYLRKGSRMRCTVKRAFRKRRTFVCTGCRIRIGKTQILSKNCTSVQSLWRKKSRKPIKASSRKSKL